MYNVHIRSLWDEAKTELRGNITMLTEYNSKQEN